MITPAAVPIPSTIVIHIGGGQGRVDTGIPYPFYFPTPVSIVAPGTFFEGTAPVTVYEVDARSGIAAISLSATPADGAVIGLIDVYGASTLNPISLTVPLGITINNPANPGNYGNTAILSQQGGSAWWRYNASLTKFVQYF